MKIATISTAIAPVVRAPKRMRVSKQPSGRVAVSSDVKQFVTEIGLEAEFDEALRHLKSSFDDSAIINVSLVECPDEKGAESRILFNVKSDLDRKNFRERQERFYAPLRSGNLRLYDLIGLLRDF